MADTRTPSAILSAAADLIRDTAAAADDGPWIVYRDGWCILSQPDRDDRATWRTVCSEGFAPENGRWIALLSPAVAPLLADWLESEKSCLTGVEVARETLPKILNGVAGKSVVDEKDVTVVIDTSGPALAFARHVIAVLGVQEEVSDGS